MSDFCDQHNIPFVLGHALYMKAIHGGKTKDDKIDSHKIVALLRGGLIPQAYVYPQKMRATRDLLRRRMHFMRAGDPLQKVSVDCTYTTKNQYNLPDFEKKIAYKRNAARKNQIGIEECFQDKSVRKSVQADLFLLDSYDKLLTNMELYIQKHAKVYDPQTFYLLKTTPGIGKILGLVILYEINDIARFPKVQNFIPAGHRSYARLIKPKKTSKGKKVGKTNGKIGNAHLKWALLKTYALLTFEAIYGLETLHLNVVINATTY